MFFKNRSQHNTLSETKINDSFPSAQFDMGGYNIRARRDRECVKRGVICKGLKDFETTISEYALNR